MTHISKLLLAMCCCAVQGCTQDAAVAPECAPVAAAPPATAAAIASTLAGIKEQYKLNAIIFGAEQDGTPLVRTALGVSTNGVPATTQMHFRIGGVGWQYLATVMLRMFEQNPGQLALTDSVAKWYPDYPNAERTTLRMLAASSAGFGDYITPQSFIDDLVADPLRYWSADDLLVRSVPPYQVAQFNDPGRAWQYSHTDFVMLGAILEKVSGKKYAVLLQELVLDPLGQRDTRLQFDAAPQLPVLHTLQEGDFQDSTYWNPSFVSWAALTSNICDLGAWTRAFGTASLLSPGLKGETTAPVNVGLPIPSTDGVPRFVTADAYFGLGTVVYPPWIVQRAAYWGMYTTTAYDPTTGISLSATISLSPDSPANIQPSNEIITAISMLLTPGHPVPR
ncbi:MAG: serine hydrolase domain-containing protein [Casimicrobiaceae bacterium]